MAEDTRTERQKFWSSQIGSSKKRIKSWRDAGKKTVKVYRDDQKRDGSQFNVLWVNTEILKPATLSRVSRPNVTRRYKNDDQVAGEVAEILERVCAFIHDESEFSDELKLARDDFLLPGRGVVRYKYKANFVKRQLNRISTLVTGDDDAEQEVEAFELDGALRQPDGFGDDVDRNTAFIEDIATEEIIPEYVYWQDFLTSNSRNWNDTWWVAFRHGMAVDELVDLFDEDRVKDIKLPRDTEEASDSSTREVLEVWEIWDKRRRKRIWFVDGSNDTFESEEPPIDLKNFFPCPKPLVPFSTTDTMTPTPLYNVYKDQAEELDVVTERLSSLITMLKFAGVYDATQEDKTLDLTDLTDGEFKAVQGVADFRSSGGFDGAIFSVPIEEISKVVESLTKRQAALKAEIFELTGIADIMRGHTDPQEGVGTQRIKTVFGTLRLRPLREPIEDFIRESYEIITEIAADKFQPRTFQAYTGKLPSPEAMDLMQSDNLRQFRINVETDSTVIPNEEIDRANAAEFLSSMSAFMNAMLPIVQAAPQLGPMVGEMAKFAARSFKAGRELEDVISEGIDTLTKAGQQPQQQQQEQPDPKVQVAQINQQTAMGKAQADAQAKAQAAQMAQQTELIKLEVTRQIAAEKNAKDIRVNELDVIAGGQPLQ